MPNINASAVDVKEHKKDQRIASITVAEKKESTTIKKLPLRNKSNIGKNNKISNPNDKNIKTMVNAPYF